MVEITFLPLISKTSINIEREDVSKIHNCNSKCGFEMSIPDELPIINNVGIYDKHS